MDRIKLRGYRESDVAAMYALDVVCFEPPFRFSRRSMRRFAEAKQAHVTIAEKSEALVGFCIVHPERAAMGRVGYVVTLDVAPASRRSGLGRELMREAERHAYAEGCAALALHVFAGNESACGSMSDAASLPRTALRRFMGTVSMRGSSTSPCRDEAPAKSAIQ